MSSGELVLTLFVALLVFSPTKLPLLARHLGQIVHRYQNFKQQLMRLWQNQVHQHQLQENLKRAHEADARYQLSQEDLQSRDK